MTSLLSHSVGTLVSLGYTNPEALELEPKGPNVQKMDRLQTHTLSRNKCRFVHSFTMNAAPSIFTHCSGL